ncbi:MAG: hypothetical protein DRP42_03545 [Tenericutes bacterium]|nr:MAG: hypothetical protein DRP42_03545 [Mycoplasmatota bacterium]
MVKSTYIFFDLETTNLSVLTSDIIEFGAVKVDETGVEERLQMFIKTEKQLSKFTTELTGITQSMVDQKGVEPEEAYRKIKSFIGDSILVAHNAMFDYTHLNNAFKHHGLGTIENTIIDTMKMS